MDSSKNRMLNALVDAGKEAYENKTVEDKVKSAEEKVGNMDKTESSEVIENIKVFCSLAKDYVKGNYKVIPWKSVLMIIGAIVYFVVPTDVWSDLLPGGYIDDKLVASWVLAACSIDILTYKEWKQSSENTAHLDEYLDKHFGADEVARETEVNRLSTLCTDDTVTDARARAAKALESIEG